MSEVLYDKILGSLYASAMGDALGAPTETMSAEEILHYYGKRIDCFVDGAVNPAFHNARVGEISDDTSQMYETAKAIIAENGAVTPRMAADALLKWADSYPKYYPICAGPTTKAVIDELRRGDDPVSVGKNRGIGMPERGCSNGAAMRIAPTGLIHPGNVQEALRDAFTVASVSHGTQIGFASACAVAGGVAEALSENSDVFSIARACIRGAKYGEKRGLIEGTAAPGASVAHRMQKAVSIAYDCETPEEAERRLNDAVGADSSAATSAVAVAVGLFVAADGDPMQTIISCANVGGDTDTIGCIAGAIAGAYAGYSSLSENWCKIFDGVNTEIDLRDAAKGLYELALVRR